LVPYDAAATNKVEIVKSIINNLIGKYELFTEEEEKLIKYNLGKVKSILYIKLDFL